MEADLPDPLQRRDRGGEMQAWVAELRQHDRIFRPSHRERQANGGRCGLRAHRGDGRRQPRGLRVRDNGRVKLERARAIVDFVVSEASAPVLVFVADDHGELVAAATMDGAAPDTRLNAQRKAYTAARSDARTTRELAQKVRDDAVERASFDPFFTFFLGGVAVFDGELRIGAVGVSGLPGDVDEQLALAAIER